MSEQPYTPDEFNVRMEWVTNGIGPDDDLNAEFDRFIAKVKADAWDEGWADCDEWRRMAPASQSEPDNPYRQEATR